MSDRPPFVYSAISHRPALPLPDGKRLAVIVAVNVEHYTWGQPALSLAQFTANLTPDPVNYSWREYGARVGVFRLMDMFDRFEIPVTAPVNSEVCDRYPQIIKEGQKRRWCWVAHGPNNSGWLIGMEPEQEREALELVSDRIATAVGQRPRGWLGPALTESPHTNQLLSDLGYTYTLNWGGIDDEPVRLEVADGDFIAVPYGSEFNDIPAFVMQGQSGDDWAQTVIDQFDQLLEEGNSRARIMSFGIHPFLTGQPHRARRFMRALEHMAGHRDDVWFTTSDDVAEWYLGLPR